MPKNPSKKKRAAFIKAAQELIESIGEEVSGVVLNANQPFSNVPLQGSEEWQKWADLERVTGLTFQNRYQVGAYDASNGDGQDSQSKDIFSDAVDRTSKGFNQGGKR